MAGFNNDRISGILMGSRSMRIYPFPGHRDITIAVRLLSDGELDDVRAAAQAVVRDQAKKRGWKPEAMVEIDPDCHQRAIERHIVFRSMFDPETIQNDDPARFFETPEDVAKLDSSTVTMLMHLYLEHQEWVNPLEVLDQEQVDELIDALGKASAPEVFLAGFAPNTLRRFAISMASRLRGS